MSEPCRRIAALFASLFGIVAGCGVDMQPPDSKSDPGTQTVRLVSLSPHLTEIAYAAGAGDNLVGAVDYSDYPAQAQQLPRIGDAFQLDLERLATLNPDHVLAWDTGNPIAMIEHLKRLGYDVAVIATETPADVEAALLRIGKLSGTDDTARNAAAEFRQAISDLELAYRNATPVDVFYQISWRPLYTIGGSHYIDRLLQLCGGRNVFSTLEAPAAAVGFEAVLQADPEVILIGDDIPGDPFARWREWPEMRAVAAGNLYKVRANLISRATPRSADGARDICNALDKARSKAGD